MRRFTMANGLGVDALQRLQRRDVGQHRWGLLLRGRRCPVQVVITGALLLPYLLFALNLLPQSLSDGLTVHGLIIALALGSRCQIGRVSVVDLVLLLLVEIQK